jgi:hypothetical protein
MYPEIAARANVAKVEEAYRLLAESARLRWVPAEASVKIAAIESNLKGPRHGG